MTGQWVDELVRASVAPDATCLRVLGTPTVRAGDRDVAVPESAQRVLVFLALRRGRVDRRMAAGALWPEAGEDRAAGNMRSALWRLRRAGLDLLRTDKHNLWADPGLVVDVDVVDRWAGRLVAGRFGEADLRVGQYGAEVLELLPSWYDEWIVLERERSRQRLLHALEALSGALVAAGRTAEGLDVALSVVAAEPLRESGQRVLIAAHLAEGNWVEARRSFLAYAAVLRRELGIAPPPDAFATMVAGGSSLEPTTWLRSVGSAARPAPAGRPASIMAARRYPARV